MSAKFEKTIYRIVFFCGALLSVIAGVTALVGATGVALALLALAFASIPLLLHLQTRQLVQTQARADKRSIEHLLARIPKGSGSDSREVDLQPVLATQAELARDLRRLSEIVEGSSASEVSTFANEIRRESRMLRLTASQLVEEIRVHERD